MYICICHAVTDTKIRAAIDEGATTFRDVSARTGCGTQCGSCVPKVRQVMDEALQDRGMAPSQVSLQVVART